MKGSAKGGGYGAGKSGGGEAGSYGAASGPPRPTSRAGPYVAAKAPSGGGGPVMRPSTKAAASKPSSAGGGGAAKSAYAGGEAEEEWVKTELAERVKQIQRESYEGKESWWKYADAFRTGSRDPHKHLAGFLREFVEAYDRGEEPVYSQNSEGGEDGGSCMVLKLRGLPFTCKAADIAEFLLEYGVDESQVELAYKDGRVTGEAYVTFDDSSVAEQAMEEKHKEKIGTRYIELFRSNEEERDYSKGASPAARPAAGAVSSRPTLRLRGLPFSTKEPEIADFLAEYGVKRHNVAMDMTDDGRPSGEAFVTFTSAEVADRAEEEMQHAQMGTRYIELFKANFQDWSTAKAKSGAGGAAGPSAKGAAAAWGGSKGGWDAWSPPVAAGWYGAGAGGGWEAEMWPPAPMKGFFGKGKDWDAWGGKGWDSWDPWAGKGGGDGGKGDPWAGKGDAWSQGAAWGKAAASKGAYGGGGSGKGAAWGGEGDFEASVANVKQIQKSGEEEKQKWWSYCETRGMNTFDPARHSVEFLKGFLRDYNSGALHAGGGEKSSSDSAHDTMEDDGTVVRLRGMPFSAGNPEVVQFLMDYGVDEAQVAINYGSDGRPTGEAFAIFNDGELAKQAVQELHHGKMGARYIELFAATYAEWARATESFERYGNYGPPSKRSHEASTGDDELDGYVNRIKAIQRSGDEEKQKWWTFCDSRGVSGYDPKRHDVNFLADFLAAFDAGEL